jgi:hypothetical protein
LNINEWNRVKLKKEEEEERREGDTCVCMYICKHNGGL